MVGSIQGASRSALEAMRRISTRVEAVDQLSRSIEDAVGRQTGTIAEISSNAKFVDEQAATITEVVTNSGMKLSEAATVIGGIRKPIEQIQAEVQSLEGASETLARLGGELGSMLQGMGVGQGR